MKNKISKYFSWSTIKKFIIDDIWNSNNSNLCIASSVAVGVFIGLLPFYGYQSILAIAVAMLFKLSKIITFAFSNVSIPPMIPFILFGSYSLGAIILGHDILFSLQEITFEIVITQLFDYIIGGFILALIIGLLLFILTYSLLCIFRKNYKSNN